MVGTDGILPLPWIEPLLRRTLASQHAHALLLQGPRGVGQFELALTLAQAWLCEADVATPRPCGVCGACRLVQAHSHPDLLVLVPEAMQEALGWSTADEEATEKESKKKPSKEIKVEALRAAVVFSQTTSARGRVKAVVVHPAERMNGTAANTLLKTLEEPPGDARFVLSCSAPEALLPTIRSRCQTVTMTLPPAAQATQWLTNQGVPDAAVMLAAAGGQPQDALEMTRQGIDAALWTRLPQLVKRGEATPFLTWPLSRLIETLQKLNHDVACVAAGTVPRYFPATAIQPARNQLAVLEWTRELVRAARHSEHPWNAALMVESLVQQGQRVLSYA